jgi:hypothetical protein
MNLIQTYGTDRFRHMVQRVKSYSDPWELQVYVPLAPAHLVRR